MVYLFPIFVFFVMLSPLIVRAFEKGKKERKEMKDLFKDWVD